MTDPLLLYEVADGIAILTLNNPRKRNVLSRSLMTALKERLDAIREDTDVGVVILRAEGPVFSSGHDLRELSEGTTEDHASIFALCTEVMEAVRLLPQPVIAEIQGLATAAGCQLVASCDLAVASEGASFATPGVEIGLFCTTPGVAVARAIAPRKALEMLLTGTPVPAHEAQQAGLVNKVVPAEDLEKETIALARRIAAVSSATIRLGKEAFHRQMALDRSEAYKMAEGIMVENLLASDAQEGIDAFLGKRPPRWET